MTTPFRRWRPILLALGAWLSAPAPLPAHDIPARVSVLMFVRPEGQTLRVVVRVPLEAMRDLTFPLRGPGYLDLSRAEPLLQDAAALWVAGSLVFREGGRPLPDGRIASVRVALPSDRSFESYPLALAHVTGPALPAETELVWQQALLDVLIEYPIASDRSEFVIDPTLARLGVRTSTVVRFAPADRPERAYEFLGDPGPVRLDPRWYQAALTFVRLGFRHILDGIDHLLFVFCLVIPLRRLRPLIATVTAFTVAHSLTLIASTAGLAPSGLWFPPLVEVLIALSILYMAIENILGARPERRWRLAFGFGLIHGFGFAFALRQSLQFAGAHLATSLLSFNVGVELGQILVLLVAVPALAWLLRRIPERTGGIILSAFIAHTAWHWMADRWSILRQYRIDWQSLGTASLSTILPGLVLLVLVIGVATGMGFLVRRFAPSGAPAPTLGADGRTAGGGN